MCASLNTCTAALSEHFAVRSLMALFVCSETAPEIGARMVDGENGERKGGADFDNAKDYRKG